MTISEKANVGECKWDGVCQETHMNQRVIRSDRPIHQLLEKHIKASEHPITCVKLMEIDEIREEALR